MLRRNGRQCQVCTHPRRDEINRLIVEGAPSTRLSEQFNLEVQAVRRHVKNHLPKAAFQDAEQTRGMTLIETAHGLLLKAQSLLTKAEGTGDYATALRGVREASRCVELLGRLQGDIQDNVNILVNPHFMSVQALILGALSDEPSARAKVIAALTNHAGVDL